MKIAILRDSNPESSKKWEIACEKKSLDYIVIDMMRDDWFQNIQNYQPNFCLTRPPGSIQQEKKVFDEKLYFLVKHTSLKIYPGYSETIIYENKAALAWFLQVNKISQPQTFVTYSREEAKQFISGTKYPIVAKTLIGAAGSGVKTIKSFSQAEAYVNKAFTDGIKRRYGPNRKTGSPSKWLVKAMKSPAYFVKKLKEYKKRDEDVQKGVVLFQQYINHDFEWRCVRIGESYFAYKKLKVGEMTSGSKQFEYDAPPFRLLDFTKELCEKFGFNYMAVDVFYSSDVVFVNELQTIFGHKNPFICKVDGKPGRYLFKNNEWIFEPGDFNTNESYDLRLETALKLYEESK